MLCDDDDLLVSGHVERMMRGIGRSDLAYSDVEIFDYVPDVQGVRQPTRRFLFAYENDPVAMRRFSTFCRLGLPVPPRPVGAARSLRPRNGQLLGLGFLPQEPPRQAASEGCRWPACLYAFSPPGRQHVPLSCLPAGESGPALGQTRARPAAHGELFHPPGRTGGRTAPGKKRGRLGRETLQPQTLPARSDRREPQTLTAC